MIPYIQGGVFMSTAIVYYSLEGNSDYIAKQLSNLIEADLFRIKCEKEIPSKNFMKFIYGGKQVVMNSMPKLKPLDIDINHYTNWIFISPIWASKLSPALHNFLKLNDINNSTNKLILCNAGGSIEKAVKQFIECTPNSKNTGFIGLKNPLKNKHDASIKLKNFINA